MTQATLIIPLKHSEISVIVQKNPRAKRLGLRLDPGQEIAYLVAPFVATEQDIRSFLTRHISWLEKKLATRSHPVPFLEKSVIPVLGHSLQISYHYNEKPTVKQIENFIHIEGFDPIIIPGLVKDWLREHIYHYLNDRSQTHAKTVMQSIRNITIKDLKSRWGSCSHNGNLAYSWRLVFAPAAVVDYVCAHEVAHLIEMNHSQQFWRLVHQLCPDYVKHRQWLKTHGQSLFRYG